MLYDSGMNSERQNTALKSFRELHHSGCFVLPNPFDIGSAKYLQQLGFKALATTSAGFAFTRGLPDEVSAIPRNAMLEHIRELVSATTLPVNADFQNGYADEPEAVAESVRLCVATGVAGLSIEDNAGNGSLYDDTLALERVKAARRAIDETGVPIVLTARCEAWLVGQANPFEVAIRRLTAFAGAGADCLFAPGVSDPQQISQIVKAVAPRPVNVLVSRPDPNMTQARLADLGVRRISVGSSLARVAWGAFIRAARRIAETGTFDSFGEAASFAELNHVFKSN
jgi:2-methylisocitrate lyase-like PEP mutase family enzyme